MADTSFAIAELTTMDLEDFEFGESETDELPDFFAAVKQMLNVSRRDWGISDE